MYLEAVDMATSPYKEGFERVGKTSILLARFIFVFIYSFIHKQQQGLERDRGLGRQSLISLTFLAGDWGLQVLGAQVLDPLVDLGE